MPFRDGAPQQPPQPRGFRYSQPAPKPQAPRRQSLTEMMGIPNSTGGKDVGRSAAGGILDGVLGSLDTALRAVEYTNPVTNSATGIGGAPHATDLLHRMITTPAYNPQTTAGHYAHAAGQFLPNALLPGGAVRRIAQVAVPALTSETAGLVGDQISPAAGSIARLMGAVVGGGAAGIRRPPPLPTAADFTPSAAKALTFLARKTDVPNIQSRAEAFRNAGHDATLADVVDDSGRGVIGAAAMRQTPGRQAVRNYATQQRVDAQGNVSRIARRVISPTPRPLDNVVDNLEEQRANQAQQDYPDAYAQPVEVTPQILSAIGDQHGRSAVGRALAGATARRDADQTQELTDLLDALHQPAGTQIPPVSAGSLDRIQIALGRRARSILARPGAERDIASGLLDRQGDLNTTLDNVPGLAPARAAYRDMSSQIDAANTGSDFLTADPDQFSTALSGQSPAALQAARDAAARSVQVAGGRPGAAPGVLDTLATGQNAAQKATALLGPDDAARLQQEATLARQRLDNARQIDPGFGSKTSQSLQDASGISDQVGQVASIAAPALQGRWLAAGHAYLKTLGLNDSDAATLTQMAVDPAQTDRAIQYLQQTVGTTPTSQFLLTLRQAAPALGSSAALALAPAAPAQ